MASPQGAAIQLANVSLQTNATTAASGAATATAISAPPKPTPNVTAQPVALSTRRKSAKVSSLFELDPTHQRSKWMSIVLTRLLLIGLWLVALIFGGTSFFVYINEKNILGYEVDVDTQLAFLGIFNKVMDVLVITSLEDLTSVVILGWMLSGADRKIWRIFGTGSGVHLSDFETLDEISKPWRAIGAFWTRCTTQGWAWTSLLRLTLILTVSVCVLLQGLAINTLGIPKERWFPDSSIADKTSIAHPSMQLNGIDISSWNNGWHIVGNGRYSWDAAGAYSLAAAYLSLEDLVPEFSQSVKKWRTVGSDKNNVIVMDTRYDGIQDTRGVAIQSTVGGQVFDWLRANGTAIARSSMGWLGSLQMVLPMVSVHCSNQSSLAVRQGESVTVEQNSTNSSAFRLWTTSVSSEDLDGTPFDSMLCSINLSRVVYPIGVYLKDLGQISVFPDNINALGFGNDNQQRSPDQIDILMADQIRLQMIVIMSRLETFVSNLNAVQFLARNARWMRSVRGDLASDAAGLAPSIALFCTHVLAHAQWDYSLDEDLMLESRPIRWQIYAAGPRIRWEWIAAVVLGTLILVHAMVIFQSFIWRTTPPEFMRLGGMLVAANCSDRLLGLKSSNGVEKTVENETLFLRQMSSERVTIVESADKLKGQSVDFRRRLKWL